MRSNQKMSNHKTAIIIGAGPAGLTAAYELLTKTTIRPLVFEAASNIGGLAKTINHRGNLMDLGGHRFFSKSETINNWWLSLLPVAQNDDCSADVMLERKRLSRIYFLNKFFDYPLALSWQALKNLGPRRVFRIIASYIWSNVLPINPELTLEDFFINRFGRELYNIFFKDYTKKLWGFGGSDLGRDWGEQRVRKLSIYRTLLYALKKSLNLKNIQAETTLTDKFFYPKYGPGQFWEKVAAQVLDLGGEIHTSSTVVGLENVGDKIISVTVKSGDKVSKISADYVFSSMPVKELIAGFSQSVPRDVVQVSSSLRYRDFITVGLLLKKLPATYHDNWIYIQDRDFKLGRIQIFNNWSPYLVKNSDTIWLGLEYFCFENDEFWSMSDIDILQFAKFELAKVLGVVPDDIADGVVIRVPKAYPIYSHEYNNFHVVRKYLDQFSNLFLIGRNGMHRYNNMDHSMLTAIVSVNNVIKGDSNKDNIWQVNTEADYHEQK